MLLLHLSRPLSITRHRQFTHAYFLIVERRLRDYITLKAIQGHTQMIVRLYVHLVMLPSVEIMISNVIQRFMVETSLINVKVAKRVSQGKE